MPLNSGILQQIAQGGQSLAPEMMRKGAQLGQQLKMAQQADQDRSALQAIAQAFGTGGSEQAIRTAGELGQLGPALQIQQRQAAQQAAEAKANQARSSIGKLREDFKRGLISQEDFRSAATALAKGSGTTVNVHTGKIPLGKKGVNDVQKDIIAGRIEKIGLGDIRNNFDESFLTFGGKAANVASGLIDKAGFGESLPEKGALSRETLKKQTKFKQSVQQTFNRYRKEITGAAAAVQELADLQKALFNLDQSPTEFKAALDNYEAAANRIDELRIELLQEGIDPRTPEGGKALDDRFLGRAQPSQQPNQANGGVIDAAEFFR